MVNHKVADVSVIIPVYNSGMSLNKAVKSVLQQTVLPKEIIVVDDCSDDLYTKYVLSEIVNHSIVRVIYLNENRGAGYARNMAWESATSKYIAFLDSDDIWHPQKLSIQYKYMQENPDVILSCHHMDVLNDATSKILSIDENRKFDAITINPIRYLFKHYPRGGTSFAMLLRDIPFRFDKTKRYSEDYLLWLEIAFNYKTVLLDKVMAYSLKERYGEGGLSQDLWCMEKGELDTFKQLRMKAYISYPLYCSVTLFSLFKYLGREVICFLRNSREKNNER